MSFLRKPNETTTLVVDDPIPAAEPSYKTNTTVTKPAAKNNTNTEPAGSLLAPSAVEDLRQQWESILAGFIDEPREAVKDADALVASAIKKLTETCTEARNKLESQWSRGEASTEDLRIALKRYRAFFQQITAL